MCCCTCKPPGLLQTEGGLRTQQGGRAEVRGKDGGFTYPCARASSMSCVRVLRTTILHCQRRYSQYSTVRRVTILWHTSAKPQWVCGPGRVPRNRLTMLYDIASGTQVRPPVRRPAPTAPENRPPQKTKIATNLYNVEIKCFWGGTAFAKAVQPLPSRTSRSPGAP